MRHFLNQNHFAGGRLSFDYLVVLLATLCLSPAVHAQSGGEDPSQAKPSYVTVIGGTQSGYYDADETIPIQANQPPEGMVFLRWWGTDAPGRIALFRETRSHATIQIPDDPTRITMFAVAGKLQFRIPPLEREHEPQFGILLPAPETAEPERQAIELHLTFANHDAGDTNVDLNQLMDYLSVPFSWFPVQDTDTQWGTDKVVSFWTQESGGEELQMHQQIPESLWQQEDTNHYVARFWYQPEWKLSDLQSETNPDGKPYRPTLGLQAELTVHSMASYPDSYHVNVQQKTAFFLPVEVKEVEFHGNQTVKKDDGTGDYTGKDWLDGNDDGDAEDHLNGDQKWPICYVKGDTMGVSAKFEINGADGMKVKVRAKAIADNLKANGQNEILFEPAQEFSIQNGVLEIPRVDASSTLNSAIVNHSPEMKIEWEFSFNEGAFTKIAESANEVFVLFKEPVVELGEGAKVFRSAAHLACSQPGATTNDQVVANIWKQLEGSTNFKGWSEANQDYSRKFYYYQWGVAGGCEDAESMLKDGNGTCVAWSQLMRMAIELNGVAAPIKNVTVNLDNPDELEAPMYMLIQNWKFKDGKGFGNSKIIFENIRYDLNQNKANTEHGDLLNLEGIAGQNEATPFSKVFANYYILKYDNTFYDPSYGVTYDSPDDFEQNVFGVGITFDDAANPPNLDISQRTQDVIFKEN